MATQSSSTSTDMGKSLSERKSVVWTKVRYFSGIFWLLLYCHAIMNGTWSVFIEISTEFISRQFPGTSMPWLTKGLNIMIVPVLLTGFCGHFLCVAIGTCCFGLILLKYAALYISPLIGMFCISLSLSLGSIALVSSIPVLVSHGSFGSALGIQKCASNVGTALMHQVSGSLQDFHQNYDLVMTFLIVSVTLALLLSISMTVLDSCSFQGRSALKDSKAAAAVKMIYHVVGDDLVPEELGESLPTIPEKKGPILPLAILLVLFICAWSFGLYSLFSR
jgi:hypothetical protein